MGTQNRWEYKRPCHIKTCHAFDVKYYLIEDSERSSIGIVYDRGIARAVCNFLNEHTKCLNIKGNCHDRRRA
jgi:hypothetical protein